MRRDGFIDKGAAGKRIVASNPDGLGDLMLRQPLYRALLEAGHLLLLVVRESNAWLARHLFPEVSLLTFSFDPYAREFLPRDDVALDTLLAGIRGWQPDTLLAAPFNHTSLERALVRNLPELTLFSMHPAGQTGLPQSNSITIVREMHELEKNSVMAARLLGHPIELPRPVLQANSLQRSKAAALLDFMGLQSGRLWIATLGTNPAVPDRALANWHEKGWTELLRHAIATHGLSFLILGSNAEEPGHRRILDSLGDLAISARVVPELPPAELAGLLCTAQGYLGRDTGIAHLAAAAGLPVLTALGGGLGARFVPAAARGKTFTVAMPCHHCEWVCPFKESWCVKTIPLSVMTQALDDIVSKAEDIFYFVSLAPSPALLTKINAEAAVALKDLIPADAAGKQGDSERRIHIGHHFYGAGNFGDDLMLSGFLLAVKRSGLRIRLTCCIPFDRDIMQRRFPEIEWLPYTPASRLAAIQQADHWLGLGGTPFQTDSGDWMVRHLDEESVFCRAAGRPMIFLGCGVGNPEALQHPVVRRIIASARKIWTRDPASLAALQSFASANAMPGADLAHLFLGSFPHATPAGGSAGLLLNFEKEELFSPQAIESLMQNFPSTRWHWLVQEARALQGSERSLFEKLSPAAQQRLALHPMDYGVATLSELIDAWPGTEVLISSRYHGALLAAWQGTRVTCIDRNAKIAGLAAQLNLPLMQLIDASFSTTAMNSAKTVSKDQLRQLEQQASAMCEEYLAALPEIAGAEIETGNSPAGIASEMMQRLARENRIQREAAEERLAAIHQLTKECERLSQCNVTLHEQLCQLESPDPASAT